MCWCCALLASGDCGADQQIGISYWLLLDSKVTLSTTPGWRQHRQSCCIQQSKSNCPITNYWSSYVRNSILCGAYSKAQVSTLLYLLEIPNYRYFVGVLACSTLYPYTLYVRIRSTPQHSSVSPLKCASPKSVVLALLMAGGPSFYTQRNNTLNMEKEKSSGRSEG